MKRMRKGYSTYLYSYIYIFYNVGEYHSFFFNRSKKKKKKGEISTLNLVPVTCSPPPPFIS